jgi:branched-chain amino acid transport system ATP-binding protein
MAEPSSNANSQPDRDGDTPGSEGAMLSVGHLSFSFAGVQALADVSLEVAAGECVGLIGPNGAGKTTLLNCITRLLDAPVGSIQVNGIECRHVPTAQISSLGVKRTFQNIATFHDMLVEEVLSVGAHYQTRASFVEVALGAPRVARETRHVQALVEESAAALGITNLLKQRVRDLPYGYQKKVDIARALIGGAKVLLMDEPAAGLSEWEWKEILEILVALKATSSTAILVVEHQLDFVRRLADRLYALDAGQVIAEGTPEAVFSHPDVVAAYVGTAE